MTQSLPVSHLFVPGDRADRIAKALASSADRVVVDLEDAVLPAHKDAARRVVREVLAAPAASERVIVRINAPGTDAVRDDLASLAHLGDGLTLMVPKSSGAADFARLTSQWPRSEAPPRWIALVETARGVLSALEIARAPGVERLAFGHLDFCAETGIDPDEPHGDELLVPLTALVLASTAAGLPAPVAGVTPQARDADRLALDSARVRALGYGGKLAIHPAQLEGIHAGFAPQPGDVAWAERVVAAAEAADHGAVSLDGALVDPPVVARARRVLGSVRPS